MNNLPRESSPEQDRSNGRIGPTRVWMMMWGVLLLLMSTLATSSLAAPADVDAWIDGLQSDQRSIRAWATQQLLDGGNDVVPHLAKRLSGMDLESSIRALEVLSTLALNDITATSPAEKAIRELAETRLASTSTRAQEILETISVRRSERAERILAQLGVEFSMTAVSTASISYATPVVRTITFDDRWEGTHEDLFYLSWLARDRDISIEADGKHIDDAWLWEVAKLESLVSLKLGRCPVTDEGMAAVGEMRRLRDIRIYYTDISDAWLKHVEDATALRTLSVFGSRMTAAAIQELADKRPEMLTRHGVGGFLGIKGDVNPNGEGCLVSDVTPNAAASKADIRAGDIIVEYDGHVVSEFTPPQLRLRTPAIPIEQPIEQDHTAGPSLMELIGKNAAGEQVQIRIKRSGRYMDKEVILGEWP